MTRGRRITLPFVKMEGAGNDYVHVDGIGASWDQDFLAAQVPRLADRHRGIGADGLILLAPSARADCRMVMWNADGSRGRMCGNGLRCLAKLAHDLGHVRSAAMTVECDAGVRAVELIADRDGTVTAARAEMGDVAVALDPVRVELAGHAWAYHEGDAGNPHAVIFCEPSQWSIDAIPVAEVGAAFQALPAFPDGVNVEFVIVREGGLLQRTYERGSAETLACGSGATVAAAAALRTGRVPGPSVAVRLSGGTLVVEVDGPRLVMEGPARTVFRGEVSIDVDS